MPDLATSVHEVFEQLLPARLKSRPVLLEKIGAVCQLDITGPEGGQWSVDCSTPGGAVRAGVASQPKCTVNCTEGDFLALVNGKIAPQMAFMMGKLKVQGDIGLALKLAQILG
jgi:predicted lipid carrier protein YhbT